MKTLTEQEIMALEGSQIPQRLVKSLNEIDKMRSIYMAAFNKDPDVVDIRREVEMLRAKMGFVVHET